MRIVTGVPGLCGGPSVGSLASLCRMLALRRRDPCKNDLQEGRASLNPSQPAAVGLARTRNVTSPPPSAACQFSRPSRDPGDAGVAVIAAAAAD